MKNKVIMSIVLIMIYASIIYGSSFSEDCERASTDSELCKTTIEHNLDSLKSYFQEAYTTYPQLPVGLLESISYNVTRLKHRVPDESVHSCTGNPKFYGIMGLILDGKNVTKSTMKNVANISGYSIKELKKSPRSNIIGTAKWLNHVGNLNNAVKSDLKSWFSVIYEYTGFIENDKTSNFLKDMFAHQILTTMQNGVELSGYTFTEPINSLNLSTYFDDQFLQTLNSGKIIMKVEENAPLKSGQSADYANATWEGSNCFSSRNGTPITDVVIHDMEGYFTYTVYTLFQNCSNSVSAHYCIRSHDGFVVQLVSESDKAWHVGGANSYSIGIEHEGFANDATWYTEAMYQSSASLVRDITQSGYGISPTTCYNGTSNAAHQLDVQPTSVRIKGHCHYPLSINPEGHWDPGPNWNWRYYYDLINCTDSKEPNNTVNQAYNLGAPLTNTSPNLCLAGSDNDYFKVSANGQIYYIRVRLYSTNSAQGKYTLRYVRSGNTLTIETQSYNGSTTDTYLHLYSSNGTTQIAANDDGGAGLFSKITYTIPGSGGGYCYTPSYAYTTNVTPYSCYMYWGAVSGASYYSLWYWNGSYAVNFYNLGSTGITIGLSPGYSYWLGVKAECSGTSSGIRWTYVTTPYNLNIPNDNPENSVVSIAESPQLRKAQETSVNIYPNPFRDKSTIEYNLLEDSQVSIFVSDAVGRRVATIADNQEMTAGSHTSIFHSNGLASGGYYCTVIAGEYKTVQKIILME